MPDPKVKSFVANWSDWDISWRWYEDGKSTIRLPVTFTLELEPGSSKSDCVVAQQKRGEMTDSTGTDVFRDWTMDGPIGDVLWWNGTTISSAGFGEWDRAGLVATFKDKPGFNRAQGKLFMGSVGHGPGYFEFHTYVANLKGDVLSEIFWSMRIDVPVPGKGGMWWSFSKQR